MRSPKQGAQSRGLWYPYYAGYTAEFAADALRLLTGGKVGAVLDPWNGSGTSTTVAHSLGHDAIGLDANPALVLVARARNVAASQQSLNPISVEVLEATARLKPHIEVGPSEPLLTWFKRPAAAELCALREAINLVFVGSQRPDDSLSQLRGLAAFYYTAAFEAVRRLLNAFRASNPTWVRMPYKGQNRLNPGIEAIRSEFLNAVDRLGDRLGRQSDIDFDQRPWADAIVNFGDSRKLPMDADSIDTVLTSPPYCTRIDYVVSARSELAFMGLTHQEVKELREVCVGGPVVRRPISLGIDDIRNTCALDLLQRIAVHDSKAASTYYLKYYLNYFSDIEASCRELDRVTKSSGKVGLVVQDSYFKNIHIDLQGVVTSIMNDAGRSLDQRFDFPVGATRTSLNPAARDHSKPHRPVESLLIYV